MKCRSRGVIVHWCAGQAVVGISRGVNHNSNTHNTCTNSVLPTIMARIVTAYRDFRPPSQHYKTSATWIYGRLSRGDDDDSRGPIALHSASLNLEQQRICWTFMAMFRTPDEPGSSVITYKRTSLEPNCPTPMFCTLPYSSSTLLSPTP